MPSCGRPYHALGPAIQSLTRAAPRRLPRASSRPSSSRPSSTLPQPSNFLNAVPLSESSPQAHIRERKFNDLRDSLLQGASPSRVWTDYSDLFNIMGFEKLPLEVHQRVLRHCTPPSAQHRLNVGRRLAAGRSSPVRHVHEGRFQTIMRNIRASNARPDLDDYHFILDQFAAVGHDIGVMHVYKELIQAGIKPQPKTFSLCLQAIAYRMTLPVSDDQTESMSEQARKMMFELVREMRNLRITFTTTNLDLTIRILKDTLDMATFEELMRWGYGIDLSTPDCPPLEFLGSQTVKSDLGIRAPAATRPLVQQPFTTAALNTTIDVLGRIGNVSKLVQAFEVLTQPLPRANDHMFSSFDDDDDFGVTNPPCPTWIPPQAVPNTTSYIMLIRHLCWAENPSLARHYAREAIYWDRQKDRVTKTKIRKDCDQIPAPRISVNRGTLLPILGLSNRMKNLTLNRWLTRKLPGVLKLKRYNLEYYMKYREKVEKRQAREQAQAELKQRKAAKKAQQLNQSSDSSAVNPSSTNTVDTSTTSTPISNITTDSSPDNSSISLIERSRRNRPQEVDIFELDIDSLPPLPPPSSKEPVKLLDINLHIRVLERDIAELEEFSKQVDFTLSRNTQRVKEGLGRRVWQDQDIYLADENTRRKVSKEEWIKRVGFSQEKPMEPPPRRPASRIPPRGRSPPSFFQSNRVTKTEVPQGVLQHLTSTRR